MSRSSGSRRPLHEFSRAYEFAGRFQSSGPRNLWGQPSGPVSRSMPYKATDYEWMTLRIMRRMAESDKMLVA